jgi:membrane protein involved in colicin uptake
MEGTEGGRERDRRHHSDFSGIVVINLDGVRFAWKQQQQQTSTEKRSEEEQRATKKKKRPSMDCTAYVM